jgi:AsmA protein
VLDSRTGQPRIEGNATVSGVSALPLLKDAAGFDWIAGKGEMSIGIKGAGESARDIVESLIGQGRFSVEDGSIVGIDIAKAARGLTEGRFSDLERVPSEKTDFSELSGTFTISGGIASNDDLRMQGPLIRMTGAGTIDLPARSLDYLTRPKLVASLEGQGGAEASGLEVPVRIHGSWDDPKLDPDLKGVLQNPGAALQTVEGLAKKAGGSGKVGQAIDKLTKDAKTKKKLQGLLDNVLGGGEEAEAAPGQ